MIRFLDVLLSLIGIIFLMPVIVFLWISLLLYCGSPVFRQERLGKDKKVFKIIKFRSMGRETEGVATHLVSKHSITNFGRYLRVTKLDELPQLWNVLSGEMSLVGPRPGLANQTDLTNSRDRMGVFDVRPGITGLAQVIGIDMSTPELLAKTDAEMIASMSVKNYFRYILLTVLGNGRGDRVRRNL